MPVYPNLEKEMKRRKITKGALAQIIGVNYRTFYNKWHGLTPFTWPEVCRIRDVFFPDMTLEELFATDQ